jgi:hypothetical protein
MELCLAHTYPEIIYLLNANTKAVPAQLNSSLDSVNFSNVIDEHNLQNQILMIFK